MLFIRHGHNVFFQQMKMDGCAVSNSWLYGTGTLVKTGLKSVRKENITFHGLAILSLFLLFLIRVRVFSNVHCDLDPHAFGFQACLSD